MIVILHCCGCNKLVKPRLTDGREIYPYRKDLSSLPFWKCDACGNYVGCHHKTAERTKPLGSIPTAKIRNLRKQVHASLDPIWQVFGVPRQKLYSELTVVLGRYYHTADINTEEEANKILTALKTIEQAAIESQIKDTPMEKEYE